MYMSIRRYQLNPDAKEEAKRRVHDGFPPLFRQADGLQEYYLLDSGDGELISLALFADRADADQAHQQISDWVRQNVAQFVRGSVETLDGEVALHQAK